MDSLMLAFNDVQKSAEGRLCARGGQSRIAAKVRRTAANLPSALATSQLTTDTSAWKPHGGLWPLSTTGWTVRLLRTPEPI